jgi:hypothetical protein
MSVFIPNTTGVNLTAAWTGGATQDLTIMCWGLLPTATPAAYRNFLTAEPNLALQTFSDGVTFDAGTGSNDFTGPVLATGIWYHLAMTCRNTSTTNHYIRGYVNGQLVVTGTDVTTFTAYTSLTLGNYSTGGNTIPLAGNVRDMRIFTRALDSLSIVSEMNSKRPVNKEALLIYSPFDVDIYTDKSGHGYIWAATGTGQALQAGPVQPWPGRRMNFFR